MEWESQGSPEWPGLWIESGHSAHLEPEWNSCSIQGQLLHLSLCSFFFTFLFSFSFLLIWTMAGTKGKTFLLPGARKHYAPNLMIVPTHIGTFSLLVFFGLFGLFSFFQILKYDVVTPLLRHCCATVAPLLRHCCATCCDDFLWSFTLDFVSILPLLCHCSCPSCSSSFLLSTRCPS